MIAKILLVDDEPDILEILSYNLKIEGYEVAMAANGKEGLRVASSFKPDLIILDIMMPEMDGVELCKLLRSRQEFDDTLIAFLTAKEEDYSHISALDIGGDDYITKPIKPKVLKSRLKALLRRSKRLKAKEKAILKFEDMVIDTEKITITKNGVEFELPKKEFDLIMLLTSKPGKVFTREEIYASIWGNEVIVGERTIDVHIRKIREKIGDKAIKTVKGIGYRFDF